MRSQAHSCISFGELEESLMVRFLTLIVVAVATVVGIVVMVPMSYAMAVYREWHWPS